MLAVASHRDSVRKETLAVSGTMQISVPNLRLSPLLLPEHPASQDVKGSAKAESPRGRNPSGRINRMPCKDHLKCTCANPSCEKWHLESVRCTKLRKAANSGVSAHSHIAGLRNNLAKGLKEVATKVQLLS